jgi:hypothetical protein
MVESMKSLEAMLETLRLVGLAILPAIMIQAQENHQLSTAQNTPGSVGFGGGAPPSTGDAFAIGLMNEEGENNLDAAAANYREAIRNFDRQREGAANAIFRLGEVYRKLGRFEEAKVQYARILREFPDMVRLTELSHGFLLGEEGLSSGGRAGFGAGGMSSGFGVGSGGGLGAGGFGGAGMAGGGFGGSSGLGTGASGMGGGMVGGGSVGGGVGGGTGDNGEGDGHGLGSGTGRGAGGTAESSGTDAVTGLSPQMMQRYGISPRAGGAGTVGADRDRVERIACVNNLRQLGLAVRIYATDHQGVFPPDVGAISNELGTPQYLVCPADTERSPAASWKDFDPSAHMTYEFPGKSGREDEPQAVMFRCPIHDNVALGDGSVQVGSAGPQTFVTPPMDEIMRRRYGLGSGSQVMRRSGTRYAGVSTRSPEQEVEETIRTFFRAMATRDADLLRSVVDTTITMISAGRENATAHVVDASKPSDLLPQNDDWEHIRIGSLTVDLPGSVSSACTASFLLIQPPGNAEDQHPSTAMLARRDGRWRIVSMTIPE